MEEGRKVKRARRIKDREIRLKNGRSDRIRTYDPLVPNEVRYQAALHSDICGEN
jgi:hypothetical protein